MRQLTIADRLSVAVLLPVGTLAAGPCLTEMLVPAVGEANASCVRIAIGLRPRSGYSRAN